MRCEGKWLRSRRHLAVLAALMPLVALLTAVVTTSPASASTTLILPGAASPASADEGSFGSFDKIYGLATTPANCVEVYPDNSVGMNYCQDTDSQQWVYQNNAVFSGTFIDVCFFFQCEPFRACLSVQSGASGGNGSPIDAEPCGNGSWQEWQLIGQSLFNPQSGRCLDNTNGQNNVSLQLWDCNFGGNANQNWNVVGSQ
jgi:hypothetical protein